MKRLEKVVGLLPALLSLLFIGCSNVPSNETTDPEKIVLSEKELYMAPGDTYVLKCTFVPKDYEGTVIWTSNNEDVVTVKDGKLKAIEEGTARITATCGSTSARCRVTVTEPIKVEKIILSESDITLEVYSSAQLTVSYEPEESEFFAEPVEWSSSDESIATVDDDGLVEGVGAGSATITAQCGTKKASCSVTVTAFNDELTIMNSSNVPVSSISSESTGGKWNIIVKSRTAWTAKSNADWVRISPTSGEAEEETEVTIEVDAAEVQAQKMNTTVEFSNSSATATLLIEREGNIIAFSVSAGRQVYFAKGNLQYQRSTNSWRFADNQYDITNNNASRAGSSGWQDLFQWGTSGYGGMTPYETHTSEQLPKMEDIAGTQYDWGLNNAIGSDNAGTWRTLKAHELSYLASRSNKTAGATIDSIQGILLLPDKWKQPSGVDVVTFSVRYGSYYIYPENNRYSFAQWKLMEAAGAVFLPLYPDHKDYTGTTRYTEYWLGNSGGVTTYSGTTYYRGGVISTGTTGIGAYAYSVTIEWLPVRLVRDVE